MFLSLSINFAANKHKINAYENKNTYSIIGNAYYSGIPIVDSDGDDITIKSDSTIYNVDVVIRDQFGNVMHHSTQNIGPMETTISVQDYDDGTEKMTIDIYYEERHLCGYFE